jgi:thiamine kinase-like enzyme
MQARAELILIVAQQLGIKLNPATASMATLTASVTNQFITVQDVQNQSYLVRIDGKLWAPFTRENENYHLKRLAAHNITTHVLLNSYQHGFQLCELPKAKTFDSLQDAEKSHSLVSLGKKLKQLHSVGGFHDQYHLAKTLLHSFNKLPSDDQLLLEKPLSTLLSILKTLQSDTANHVSSHNDLLPSSVYVKGDEISMVDWEYASQNHRSYDLAFFSIQTGLNQAEEISLLHAYDPDCTNNTFYSFYLMKPVIDCLLLLWQSTTKLLRDANEKSSHKLLCSLQDASVWSSAKTLLKQNRLLMFSTTARCIEQVAEEQSQPHSRKMIKSN